MESMFSLTRDSGYADRLRDYRVLLDGKEIGCIADGHTMTFVVPPGEHELRLKVDWCGSNTEKIHLNAGERTALRCGSSLRGYKAFFILFHLFYTTVAKDRYLWLKAEAN